MIAWMKWLIKRWYQTFNSRKTIDDLLYRLDTMDMINSRLSDELVDVMHPEFGTYHRDLGMAKELGREALKKYGQHQAGCGLYRINETGEIVNLVGIVCECGLNTVIEKLEN